MVTDIEGTVSRPAVAAVKTSEARTYVEPVVKRHFIANSNITLFLRFLSIKRHFYAMKSHYF